MPVNKEELDNLKKPLLAWIEETTDEEQKNARRLAFVTITDAYQRDLKKLDLRNIGINSIDSIFENILQLNYVEYIDFSNNNLKNFPEVSEGLDLPNLIYINLDNNSKFTIPPSLFKRAPNLHIAEDRKPPTSYTNIAATTTKKLNDNSGLTPHP